MKWEADDLFKVRSANVGRYKRNFLRQVVCEFRFPTMMEFATSKPPAAFVNALRKEYPTLEQSNEVTVPIGAPAIAGSHVHVLRSRKATWSISLRSSSFSLETSSYTSFVKMKERAMEVVGAAKKVIDSDFFTRIGVRYINAIDRNENPSEGWVNPQLVGALGLGIFGGITEYAGKLNVTGPDGGALLQHGIRLKAKHMEEAVYPEYVLDIDVSRTDVELDNVGDALESIHSQAFDLFDWSLDEKSRNFLSK